MYQPHRFKHSPLTLAIAALVWGSASAVSAQTTTPPAAPLATPSTSAAPETARLADVVVTAQKISQPASKTPLAITAIGGDDLRAAGATNATGLTSLIPNVFISAGANASTDVSIRGIGSTNSTEVGDPAAAFNIDGVYLGRPQSAGATFYDLERIEVLRGPQGTLYGRNATAGAINLITKKPTAKFVAEANLSLGNFGLKSLEAMVNAPVNDLVAIRAVLSATKRDGYLVTAGAPNTFSKNREDIDNVSARVHGLFKFNADNRLLVTLDSSTNKGAGPGSVPLATFQNNTGTAQRTVLTNKNQGARDDESSGITAEFTSNLSFAEFTYLGSKRTFNRNNESSTGAVSSFTDSDFSQTSHELRLASNYKGPVSWVGGLYFYKERGNIDATFGINPFGAANPGLRFIQNPVTSDSKALFGQVTYAVIDGVRITGGIRTTSDEKARDGKLSSGAGIITAGINKASVSYKQNTWKLGTDFDIAKDILGYAHVATGYKAGGYFDGNNATGDNTYRPELLTSFEAGIKGKFLDNRLRLSAAIFSYDYKDLQISYVAINPLTNSAGTITTNAAKASNKGLELEGKFAITDNGTLNFAVGILDAKYKSFIFPVYAARPVAIDFAGKKLDKAPDTTVTLGYTQDISLANGASLTAYIGSRYSSSYVLSNFAIATPVQYTQKAFTRSDINLSYNAAGDKWSVQGYVKNLENKTVLTGYSFSSFTGNQAYLSEPRTFGIRASIRF